jgi:hypothetical protein
VTFVLGVDTNGGSADLDVRLQRHFAIIAFPRLSRERLESFYGELAAKSAQDVGAARRTAADSSSSSGGGRASGGGGGSSGGGGGVGVGGSTTASSTPPSSAGASTMAPTAASQTARVDVGPSGRHLLIPTVTSTVAQSVSLVKSSVTERQRENPRVHRTRSDAQQGHKLGHDRLTHQVSF